jgi:hypothetical protein
MTLHVERPSRIFGVALNPHEWTAPFQDSSVVNPVVIDEDAMDKPVEDPEGAFHKA